MRTYSPSITFSHYRPIRKKKSKNPEVFAFRILAATVGSYATTDTVRNANSISFVGGVPIYERFYLGSENDIRGYNSRSIGPVAPFDTYITARNIKVATNISGQPIVEVPGLDSRTLGEIASLGLLTGPDAPNPALLSPSFRFTGGDTQLLGNFEYRIPIFGPATLALFADIGSVFNLQKTGTQRINSEFLNDDTFIGAGTLTALALRNTPIPGKQLRKHPVLPRTYTDEDGFSDGILPRQPFRMPDEPFTGDPGHVPAGRSAAEFAFEG